MPELLAILTTADIAPNPEQPRTYFAEEEIKELAASIKAEGLIQPIVVERATSHPGAYILIDGERRLRAARLAGLATIPAIVHPLRTSDDSDDAARDRLTRALVANIQRSDLTAAEEARALQRMAELGLSDSQIAAATGRSRSAIANKRRLLDLPADVLQDLDAGTISERQAAALLPIWQTLTEAARTRVEKDTYSYNRPSAILKSARAGEPSERLRSRVADLIQFATANLAAGAFPPDHPFDLDAAHAPTCPGCQYNHNNRCALPSCFDAKRNAWTQTRIDRAATVTGLSILPANAGYSRTAFTADEAAAGAKILAAGCDNLRFDYAPDSPSGLRPWPDAPDCRLVCFHANGTRCSCLSAAKAAITRERNATDPAAIATKAAERERAALLDAAAETIAAALDAGHLGAWRTLYRHISRYSSAGTINDDCTLADIHAALARYLVRSSLSYPASIDTDLARKELAALLQSADVDAATPGAEPAATDSAEDIADGPEIEEITFEEEIEEIEFAPIPAPAPGQTWRLTRPTPPLKRGTLVEIRAVIEHGSLHGDRFLVVAQPPAPAMRVTLTRDYLEPV